MRTNLFFEKKIVLSTLLLFFSGFSALIYQVIWQRILSQEIGIDSLAMAVTVAVFMTGLGFGSIVGGIATKRLKENIFFVYGIVEIIIGIFGFLSESIIRNGNQIASTIFVPNPLSDFFINLILLFLPVFLMGFTTPLIIDLLKKNKDGVGRLVGIFYGINIFGAALGSIISGLFLIEFLGLKKSIYFAATVNIFLGALSLFFRNFFEKEINKVDVSSLKFPIIPKRYLIAALIFGFSTLSLQMILFRIIVYIYLPLPILFPIILTFFLIFMAFGELISGLICDKMDQKNIQNFGFILLFLIIVAFVISLKNPVNDMYSDNYLNDILENMKYICLLMIPVIFFSGFFPLLVKLITIEIKDVGENFGLILGLSTIGNILGVFITQFLLFEVVGTWGTLILIIIFVLIGCILLNDNAFQYFSSIKSLDDFKNEILLKPYTGFTMGILIIFIFTLPYNFYNQSFGNTKPLDSIEGKSGVITVIPHPLNPKSFMQFLSSRATSGRGSLVEPYRMDIWNLSGLMVFDEEYRPKKIAQIGIGEGLFHFASKELPNIEQVDVVEISSEMIKAWEKMSKPKSVADSFRHEKINLHIMDGRRFIRRAISDGEKYDLVQIGVSSPFVNGASNLYTKEMFEMIKKVLKPNGYMVLICYTPLASTALESFKNVFWMGQKGKQWIFATDKEFDDYPENLEVKIKPWLAKLFTANTARDMNMENLNEFKKNLPLDYKGFKVEFFDQEWLKSNFPTNLDDKLIYEYNIFMKNRDFLKNNLIFYQIDYKTSKTINVKVRNE